MANRTNDTELIYCFPDSLNVVIVKAVAYGLVLLFSFVGNGMVLHIFYKNRSIRNTTNSFIVNMAASDIMIPIFLIPRHIVATFEKGRFKLQIWRIEGVFGELSCKLIPYIGDVSHCVSILTLVLISVDRYIAICWPLSTKYRITPRRCNILIAATWIVALVIQSGVLYSFQLYNLGEQTLCAMFWGSLRNYNEASLEIHKKVQKFYALGIIALIYVLPLITITILYSSIIQELRSKQRMQSIHQPTHHRRQRRREDNRVIAMLVAVVSIFAAFFAPFHVSQFIRLFIWDYSSFIPCQSKDIEFSTFYLALSICSINPYIYFIFIRRYRKCARDLLKCLCGTKIMNVISKMRNWKCWKKDDTDDQETGRTTRAFSSCKTRQTELVLLALEQEPTFQFETGL